MPKKKEEIKVSVMEWREKHHSYLNVPAPTVYKVVLKVGSLVLVSQSNWLRPQDAVKSGKFLAEKTKAALEVFDDE